jgi:excisionase family DNA binding protein
MRLNQSKRTASRDDASMTTQNATIARLVPNPPQPAEPAPFLSRSAVARLFGVSASTVTRWARTGLLRTIRTPGGHYRFPAEETRAAAAVGIPTGPTT